MSRPTSSGQVDVNMTGVFLTVKAAVERIIESGRGGRIVCISSEAALTTGARVWSTRPPRRR
jgi:NAD(P)-dependent dehydrogenase (short-subunit alcohol dehydrogenase family)